MHGGGSGWLLCNGSIVMGAGGRSPKMNDAAGDCNGSSGADGHLGFFQALKNLQLQALVREFPVEALTP